MNELSLSINLQADPQHKADSPTKPVQNIDVPEEEPAPKTDLKDPLDDFDDTGLFDGEDPEEDLEAILGKPQFALPNAQNAVASPNEEEKKGEQQDENGDEDLANDPTKHRMQRESIELGVDADGNKQINEFLTIQGKIGRGAYCTVRRALGVYPPDEDFPEEERIPYALKVYEKHTLK